jgi:TonB family protein
MNRLQKKCVIATAGIHLLLLLVLLFGSAFFSPRPKPDETQLLDVIPSATVETALNSGVRQATPPAPAPPTSAPAIVPPPQPILPTPAVQPVTPPPPPNAVTPPPTLAERLEKVFAPEPKPVKPVPDKPEPKPHQIQVNTQLVARVAPKVSVTPDNSQQTARLLNNTIKNLRNNLSSPTEVTLRGDSTVAYANYDSVVKSIYDRAWTLPDSIANDDENVKVTVTIASDGTVISAHIIERAGDAPVDASVQRTLDRVTFIAPFPDGATDKERSYTINFNPKAKRTLE